MLFSIGLIIDNPIFQSRYVLIAVPAYAILCGRMLCSTFSGPKRIIVLLLTTMVSVVITQTRPIVVDENWREIAEDLIKRKEDNTNFPVLVHSTLMESTNSSWISGDIKKEYLLASFFYYKIPYTKIPLPYLMTVDQHDLYLDTVVRPIFRDHSRIYLVSRAGREGLDYIGKWFTENGFDVETISDSGAVSLGRASRND